MSYEEALAAFLAAGGGWAALRFFREGRAAPVVQRLDALAAEGRRVLPAPADLFNAFRLTPPERVKVVILGQDPYPTPGDAHGLAFSVARGAPLPRSLANVFRELRDDLGVARTNGNLADWAGQGVLLLNAALSVEAGQAGSHRRLGWQALTDEAVAAAAHAAEPKVFMLWGADAQAKRALIGSTRHLVIESAHPSPLSARRGFLGSRPFSRADAFLAAQGRKPVDWSGGGSTR